VGKYLKLVHALWRSHIPVKDSQGNGKRANSIWNVDDSIDATLTWDTRQEQVDLFLCVSKFSQILDAIENGTFVCNRGVEVVLDTLLVDRDAFEDKPFSCKTIGGNTIECVRN
jgi:hypothetical protein